MTSLAMRAVAPARSTRSRASRSSRADAGPKGLGTAVADRRAPLLDRRDRPGARLTARTGVVPKAAENSDGPSTNSAAAEAVAAAFVNAQVTSGMRVGVTAGAVVSCVLAENGFIPPHGPMTALFQQTVISAVFAFAMA